MNFISKIRQTGQIAIAIFLALAVPLTLGMVPVRAGDADVFIALTPQTATNPVGTSHTVTASIGFEAGFVEPLSFVVLSGPNAGQTNDAGECSLNLDCTPDANNQISWTYQSNGDPGTDTIQACVVNIIGEFSQTACDTASKEWTASTTVPGRMTGGGSVAETSIRHGFELHCDKNDTPNNLEVNWDNDKRFHLESQTSAVCSNDPAIGSKPPMAGFDTYAGTGMGRYNGVSGATAEWTFTDAGEPGVSDSIRLTVKDKDSNVVLNMAGNLRNGNHQAH